jgi:rhodanese-related sulfurtransferase
MRAFMGIAVRACVILLFWSSVGLAVNHFSRKTLPLVYVPPSEVFIEGVSVPLVDEREARRFMNDPGTLFIDTRKPQDYTEGHVKGAILLYADEMEKRFPLVEPLITVDRRLVLYCYGPDCEMAEQVARFLAQMGHKEMIIMSAGFHAWKKAGYPIESETPSAGTRGES